MHKSEFNSTVAAITESNLPNYYKEFLIKQQKSLCSWSTISNSGIRLKCGEMTDQEIRSIKAVLYNISPQYHKRD